MNHMLQVNPLPVVIAFFILLSVACIMTVVAYQQQKEIEDYRERFGLNAMEKAVKQFNKNQTKGIRS